MPSQHVFHLTPWDGFTPHLEPASLKSEGFVHLSTAQQLLVTAQRWFEGHQALKILVVDVDSLGPELKWEDTHGHGSLFPHLYKPLPQGAILAVARMDRNSEGVFSWPDALRGYLSPLLASLTSEIGIIEPCQRFSEKKLPGRCVLTFFEDVLENLVAREDIEVLEGLGSPIGATRVLTLEHHGELIAVCHPGVGAPLAAATVEELIALGCESFVCCGGAGSLQPEVQMGHLVLASGAVRDEGTSHHYLDAGPVVTVPGEVLATLRDAFKARGVSFTEGLTWTTDALYRETKSRMESRRAQGCLTVEMEAAALFAVAQYRKIKLASIFYCGDDVSSENWDFREWTSATTIRERLFWLAADSVLAL